MKKYKFVTLAKTNSRFDKMIGNPILINSYKNAVSAIINEHSLKRGEMHSGNYDVENVTKLMSAGDMKNTDSFEVFFDYTFDDGIVRERRRTAICRVA